MVRDYSLPDYDKYRQWIMQARNKQGKSWEEIEYGLRGDDKGLDEFLQMQAGINFWDIDAADWKELVSRQKKAENEAIKSVTNVEMLKDAAKTFSQLLVEGAIASQSVGNSNDGNTNGNNKYNTQSVRAAVAYGGFREAIKAVCEAYLDCKRGKMSSPYTIAYMEIATEDLPKLAYEIYMAIYLPTISICFLVKYPKLREVFAADFRDRIVHHWIIIRLEPLFERSFLSSGARRVWR